MRRCTKASAQSRQEVTKGRVGNTWGQRTSCVEGGAKAPERLCGWTHLRENSSSGSCVETSCETAMCGIVCVAASRGGVGMGSGGGGRALKDMQRSQNSAKESCVAASASVADIESHVTMRVGSV